MTVEVIKPEVATVSHQEEKVKVVDEVVEEVESKKDVEEAKPESVDKTSSFKEESNFVSDLKDHEKKALTDLKAKLEEAILGNTLFKKEEPKVEEVVVEKKEQVVEDVKEKEVEKVEDKDKVEGEESSKKSGEKKGWKSTIQEAFKGHGLFKKDEVKVEEVAEEKPKVEEEKKEEEKKEECAEQVVKVEEDVEVKEGEKVEEKEKVVEVGEESSKKGVEKKGLNKLKLKIGEAFKGGLFKKDEPKVEEVVVEEKPKVEEEKTEDENKEEEKKEECAEGEVVQEDGKEKESGTVEEKVEEGEESSKKSVEKKGLNKFKSTIQEAFKGHLFSKKSKKEVEEKKEELKPEGDDKVDAESKPELSEDKVEEKKEEEVVEVIKTEVCEEKEPEAVVEEVAEEIKTEEGEEEKTVEEVVEVCEEEEETKVEEEVVEVCEEEEETKVEEEVVVDKDISLWGVPLLPSKADEGTDVILLKFLRARDFKANEAFAMLKKSLGWRKEWKIDSILDEDLGTDLSSAAYMSGVDREGHPICYNIFGVLDDEELYQKTLASEEKRDAFLRWRFQLMERGIQRLEFKPTGVTSLLQINDLKNSPGPAKKEVRLAIKQALGLLQDNYPEFVARNIFINVPFWYYAYNAVFSTLLTQRTKSKLLFARPAKVTETLLKYIPVEEIPIQYGGLKRDNDFEFSAEDCTASELIIKAASTATIEIPAPEAGTTFIWDITVLGWDVIYKEEFVPTDECSYTIIVQKQKKLTSTEGPIRNTFRTNEPGKIVLTIENCSNRKKKVFYRNKVKKSAF